MRGHKKVVEFLLDNGANKDTVDRHGCGVLMNAAISGHKELVEFLLKKGVNKDTVDNYGKTAFIEAIYKQATKRLREAENRDYNDIEEILRRRGIEEMLK